MVYLGVCAPPPLAVALNLRRECLFEVNDAHLLHSRLENLAVAVAVIAFVAAVVVAGDVRRRRRVDVDGVEERSLIVGAHHREAARAAGACVVCVYVCRMDGEAENYIKLRRTHNQATTTTQRGARGDDDDTRKRCTRRASRLLRAVLIKQVVVDTRADGRGRWGATRRCDSGPSWSASRVDGCDVEITDCNKRIRRRAVAGFVCTLVVRHARKKRLPQNSTQYTHANNSSSTARLAKIHAIVVCALHCCCASVVAPCGLCPR